VSVPVVLGFTFTSTSAVTAADGRGAAQEPEAERPARASGRPVSDADACLALSRIQWAELDGLEGDRGQGISEEDAQDGTPLGVCGCPCVQQRHAELGRQLL
jgi:hypothetical protein